MGRDSIKTLDTRQRCREKISIWFGSRDNFIHPFKEALANGIDEILNNFDGGEITVKLKEDGTIRITDTGRGIPLLGKSNGTENYKLLLLELFSGTNYENGTNGKVTTGTNGCGMCVVNHTSSYFRVKSYKEDGVSSITFEDGGKITEKLNTAENNLNGYTGTDITFKLDKAVFGNYKYDQEEVKSIIRNAAGVSNKIKFTYQFEDEEIVEFKYDTLLDFFNDETTNNTCSEIIGLNKEYRNEVQEMEGSETITEIDNIELILTTSVDIIQKSYLNTTHLPEGGSINNGVITGVRNFVNKYAKENKMMDKKLGAITINDVKDSISFVCNMTSTLVEFANQTKLSTNKNLYSRIASEYTMRLLEVQKLENPKNIEKLVKHILNIQKFNNKSSVAKSKLKKELSEKVDGLNTRVDKLTDCEEHGINSEIFIAEGDSAKGSIVLSRDARYQAVLAIRGKIMNVLKKNYTEIFECKAIMDIMKSLGCGIETDKKNKDLGEFRIEDLRYGKIIIACDSDSDGFQIVCLLLALFYKLAPKLITEGYVYVINTPLYEVKFKDNTETYWFDESERVAYLEKEGGFDDIKTLARSKGLGEMQPEVMAETGVNPKTRNITQVRADDYKAMMEMFEIWLEKESTQRKEKIENNLNNEI